MSSDSSDKSSASDAAQAQQLRLLADSLPALIALYDSTTQRCQFANRAYAQAFGLDEQSVLGRTFSEVIGEAAAALIEPQVARVLRDKLAATYERYLPGSDGAPRWIEVNLIPHLDAAGRPVSWLSRDTRRIDFDRRLFHRRRGRPTGLPPDRQLRLPPV